MPASPSHANGTHAKHVSTQIHWNEKSPVQHVYTFLQLPVSEDGIAWKGPPPNIAVEHTNEHFANKTHECCSSYAQFCY